MMNSNIIKARLKGHNVMSKKIKTCIRFVCLLWTLINRKQLTSKVAHQTSQVVGQGRILGPGLEGRQVKVTQGKHNRTVHLDTRHLMEHKPGQDKAWL